MTHVERRGSFWQSDREPARETLPGFAGLLILGVKQREVVWSQQRVKASGMGEPRSVLTLMMRDLLTATANQPQGCTGTLRTRRRDGGVEPGPVPAPW